VETTQIRAERALMAAIRSAAEDQGAKCDPSVTVAKIKAAERSGLPFWFEWLSRQSSPMSEWRKYYFYIAASDNSPRIFMSAGNRVFSIASWPF
jgi:hypothetical protein